jgi:predicted RNA methylase
MKQTISPSRKIIRLIRHSRKNGLQNAALLLVKNLPRPFYEWLIRRRFRSHAAFDRKYDLDTQAPVRVAELETSAPGGRFANRYEGTPIPVVRKILRRLKVDQRQYSFIDLGSGKGRVLLAASQYPLKSVIGIEFSEKLHNIAQANIEKFATSGLLRTLPVSINIDAGAFDFSDDGNTIIFSANPFGAALMNQVLDNLQTALDRSKAEAIFVYLGPMPEQIAARLDRYQVVERGDWISEFGFFEQYSVYRIRQPPRAGLGAD